MHLSLLAVKGNHSYRIAEIFSHFEYIDKGRSLGFSDWKTMEEYMMLHQTELEKKSTVQRGIYADGNWTILFETGIISYMSSKAIEEISRSLASDIYAFIVHESSETFCFTHYGPGKQREFFYRKGEVSVNRGEPFAAEWELNPLAKIRMQDIIRIWEKLGCNFTKNQSRSHFEVRTLEYSDSLKDKLLQYGHIPGPQKKPENPWWKFWSSQS